MNLLTSDQQLWIDARDVADLCNLTSRWLTGDITYHPVFGARPSSDMLAIADHVTRLLSRGVLVMSGQPGALAETYLIRPTLIAYTSEEFAAAQAAALPDGSDVRIATIDTPPPAKPSWRNRLLNVFDFAPTLPGIPTGEHRGRRSGYLNPVPLTRTDIAAQWRHQLTDDLVDELAGMTQLAMVGPWGHPRHFWASMPDASA